MTILIRIYSDEYYDFGFSFSQSFLWNVMTQNDNKSVMR